MCRFRVTVGWGVLSWLAFAAVVSAGERQPGAELPASYRDAFKKAGVRLEAVFGVSERDPRNHVAAWSADGKLALSSHYRGDGDPPFADSVLTLWDVASGTTVKQITLQKTYLFSLRMTPDAGRALGCVWAQRGGKPTYTLVLWDLKRGQELKRWSPKIGSSDLALTPDGRRALIGDAEGNLKLWDVEQGKELSHLTKQENLVRHIRITADGKTALTCDGPTIRVWDLTAGKERRNFRAERDVDHLAVSPDGRYAAASSVDYGGGFGPLTYFLQFWDVAGGKELHNRVPNNAPRDFGMLDFVFSDDGKQLLLTSSELYGMSRPGMKLIGVSLWDVASGKERWAARPRPLEGRLPLAFVAGGRQVLLGGSDSAPFVLLDAADGKELRSWGGHRAGVYGVVLSPDGKTLHTAGGDGTLKRWDAATGQEVQTAVGHVGHVNCLVVSADGKYLLSGGVDQTVRWWDAATGKEVKTLKGHTGNVTAAVFHRDGLWAVSSGEDRTIRLWDLTAGKEVRKLENLDPSLMNVALSEDGTRALIAAENGSLVFWDLTDRLKQPKRRVVAGPRHELTCVALSRDGKLALTGGLRGAIQLWDAAAGKAIKTFDQRQDWVEQFCFSPDGKRAASVALDSTVRTWDVVAGREIDRIDLSDCDDCGRQVTFARDGRSLFFSNDNWLVLRVALKGGPK